MKYFILILLILYLLKVLVGFIKDLIWLSKVKKKVQDNKYIRVKWKIPILYFINRCLSLTVENKEHTINITLLHIRRKYAKYHFANEQTIEVYVGSRASTRDAVKASISKHITWKRKGKIKLPKWDDVNNGDVVTNILLFNRMPMGITSADPRANSYLDNGDKLFSKFYLYNVKVFMDLEFNKFI